MYLDSNAKKLIDLFITNGHKAYAVGGCVRDSIMGRASYDTDIAVSSTPDVTVSVLNSGGIRYVETGLKHGTVTAIVESVPYEITTFRTDGEYTDARRPDSVSFVTDIQDDLSRRDFTINAMAYSLQSGIVDLFGGREDIKNKIIRTVGDPNLRFGEDALRILRALRFASTLDFTVHPDTEKAIKSNKTLLSKVAKERKTSELLKLLCGQGIASVLQNYCEVFNTIFGLKFKKDAYKLCAGYICDLPCDSIMRLAFFILCLVDAFDDKKYTFCALSKSQKESATCILSSFVLSNTQKNRVCAIIDNCSLSLFDDKKQICRSMYHLGERAVCDIATIRGQQSVISIVKEIIENKTPYLISHLDIDGNDLLRQGFVGADIKKTLEMLLFAVIDAKVSNEKTELILYIKNNPLL